MELRKLIVLALLAISLSACGIRGPLEPPPGVAAPDPDEPAAIDPLIKPN
ncbi:LPS translocon maturation chaperone LptM [Anderseniella sp. Alg231-50]